MGDEIIMMPNPPLFSFSGSTPIRGSYEVFSLRLSELLGKYRSTKNIIIESRNRALNAGREAVGVTHPLLVQNKSRLHLKR